MINSNTNYIPKEKEGEYTKQFTALLNTVKGKTYNVLFDKEGDLQVIPSANTAKKTKRFSLRLNLARPTRETQFLDKKTTFFVLMALADRANGREELELVTEEIQEIADKILGDTKISTEDSEALDIYLGQYALDNQLIRQREIYDRAHLRRTMGGGEILSAGMDTGRLLFGGNMQVILPDGESHSIDPNSPYKTLALMAELCEVDAETITAIEEDGPKWENPNDVSGWVKNYKAQLGPFMQLLNAISQNFLTSFSVILTDVVPKKLIAKDKNSPVRLLDIHNKGKTGKQGRMVIVDFRGGAHVRVFQVVNYYSSARKILKDGQMSQPINNRGLVFRVEQVCGTRLRELGAWTYCRTTAEVNPFLTDDVSKKEIEAGEKILEEFGWSAIKEKSALETSIKAREVKAKMNSKSDNSNNSRGDLKPLQLSLEGRSLKDTLVRSFEESYDSEKKRPMAPVISELKREIDRRNNPEH